MFSPETFMNAVFTEANETKIVPCPVGDWPAQCDAVTPKSGTISKGDRAGETWAKLELRWVIEDPAVTAETGRNPTKVVQSIMLDLTPQGGLDMGPGKNVQLGRTREACGLNQPGQPFSPSMFVGRSARCSVSHRLDERDGQTIYAEVRAVTSL